MFSSKFENTLKEIPGIAYMFKDSHGYNRIHVKLDVCKKICHEFENKVLVHDSTYDKRWHYTEEDKDWVVEHQKAGRSQDNEPIAIFLYKTNQPEWCCCRCGNFSSRGFYKDGSISKSKRLYNQISDELWKRIESATEKLDKSLDDVVVFEEVYKRSRL